MHPVRVRIDQAVKQIRLPDSSTLLRDLAAAEGYLDNIQRISVDAVSDRAVAV